MSEMYLGDDDSCWGNQPECTENPEEWPRKGHIIDLRDLRGPEGLEPREPRASKALASQRSYIKL